MEDDVIERAYAQKVRWGPSDGVGAGIRVSDLSDAEQQFIPWSALKTELERNLLPQLFADPSGYRFELSNYHGKRDWLVGIIRHDVPVCHVWFGHDYDAGGRFDGLVRIGDAASEPHTWQTYQRFSDGPYRRLSSVAMTLDVRIPTKSAGDSERRRPPIPIEAGQGFR